MRVEEIEGGKWYPFTSRERVICCDCGLSHDIETKRVKGRLYMRWKRNERSTAAVRRRAK
jgi:hypothetical protein